MRTTVTIEDELFEKASKVVGVSNASELVKVALDKLVTSESRKRLIALGGSAPYFDVPGRGSETAEGGPSPALVAEDAAEYNAKS